MSGPRRSAGFTLIELLIVIGLISMLAGLLLPSAGGALGLRIRNASRVISAELEHASQRAIATGIAHRWVIDLDTQRYRTERLLDVPPELTEGLPSHSELLDLAPPRASSEYTPLEDGSGRWRRLDDPEVRIDEVRIGNFQHRDSEVGVTFAADGGADPAEIWLLDESGVEQRIRVLAFTGEIKSEEATRE